MGREVQTRAVKAADIDFLIPKLNSLFTFLAPALSTPKSKKGIIHDTVKKHFDYSVQFNTIKYSGKKSLSY